jgi:hypothetical protein
LYGASESGSDHALDAELAVAGALEGLGFTTELIEVALDLGSIETLPSRRPLLVFNLVDAIDCDGRFYGGYGKRCRSGRGRALLPGLDPQHRRERAESFANQRSTSFATKDRLERGTDARAKDSDPWTLLGAGATQA